MDADGKIHWPAKAGGMPMLKRYEDEQRGTPLQDVWTDIKPIHNLGQERSGFPTQKPEPLLQRIIAASSNPGDIVLDCFLGSGTTAAVAQKMGRRWVGIEREKATVEDFVLPRLRKVVEGAQPGGTGFRVLDVACSMFEEAAGQVFLSEWAVNGQLAEVTAAQLHYDYAYEPPFCGRRGRSRLVVIDGLVNEGVVRLIVGTLDADERVVICGTAIDPTARDVLRQLRPGSTVRKIPQSILQEYRQASRQIETSSAELSPDGAQVQPREAVET